MKCARSGTYRGVRAEAHVLCALRHTVTEVLNRAMDPLYREDLGTWTIQC